MKLNGLPTLIGKIWTPPEIKRKTKVTLSMCSHRKGDMNIVARILPVLTSDKYDFAWAPMIGEADICQARSRIVSEFFTKTEDDIFMFLDDDIIFEPKDIEKIIAHVENGKLICGGMYVQKPTLGKTIVLEEGESITFSKDAQPQKVTCLPTGFMAISRKVFEVLAGAKTPQGEPLVPLCNEGASWQFYPFFCSQKMKLQDGKWKFMPEDWSFCLLARMCGIDTWCDPSIFLSHIGEYAFDLRDRLRPSKISWNDFEPMTLT